MQASTLVLVLGLTVHLTEHINASPHHRSWMRFFWRMHLTTPLPVQSPTPQVTPQLYLATSISNNRRTQRTTVRAPITPMQTIAPIDATQKTSTTTKGKPINTKQDTSVSTRSTNLANLQPSRSVVSSRSNIPVVADSASTTTITSSDAMHDTSAQTQITTWATPLPSTGVMSSTAIRLPTEEIRTTPRPITKPLKNATHVSLVTTQAHSSTQATSTITTLNTLVPTQLTTSMTTDEQTIMYSTTMQPPTSSPEPPAEKEPCGSKDCYDDPSKVCDGEFTFNEEEKNSNGRKKNTKKIRKSQSGVEIGRGYKLGDKTEQQVKDDLKSAGVDEEKAKKIAKCAGKKTKAEIDQCIKDNNLKDVEISARQQRNLFEKQYKEAKAKAERLVKRYNKAKWNDLDCKIKIIFIDMVFNGDFKPAGSSAVQEKLRNGITNNNARLVRQALATKRGWTPQQRARNQRRLKYLLDHSIVCRGQFLFNNNGDNGQQSQNVRRSSQTDGLVIGRGYELIDRTKEEIVKDLKEAGVDAATADQIAKGAGKKGKEATNTAKELKGKKLTKEQQRKLFDVMFKKFEEDVKKKIEKALGIKWDDLDCRIQQIVAEMLASGDLDLDSNDAKQKNIREAIKKNDYKAFRDIIASTLLWKKIDLLGILNLWRQLIRFARRMELIKLFDNPLLVCKGQVTFDSEGNDNPKSRYYSRKFHVPGAWSGLTIGRGYDMKFKKRQQVIDDLTKIGVDKKTATKIAGAVGKKGADARKFIKDNNLEDFELTREQQRQLFVEVTYPAEEKEAKRLTEKYLDVEWDDLDCKIQEMLTDLKYRGDYLPTSQKEGQKKLREAIEANDVKKFKDVIKNKDYWKNVPKDRFNRRVRFMEDC